MNTHSSIRRCRICGCADDDCSGCIERTGHACHWVQEDLCSACVVEDGNRLRGIPAGNTSMEDIRKEFLRPLHAFALSQVHDNTIAKDLVNNAFQELEKKLGLLKNLADVKAYLYIQVRNATLRKL